MILALELTEKTAFLPVRNKVILGSHTIDSKIRGHDYGDRKGWAFTPNHFQDLGSCAAIESTFRRLKAAVTIRQLACGLYDYPVQDSELGTVAPSADAIACAQVVRDAPANSPSASLPTSISIALPEPIRSIRTSPVSSVSWPLRKFGRRRDV